MDFKFKGIRIGRAIITTENMFRDSITLSIESKEIWKMFQTAVKEGKIIIQETNEEKR